MLRSEKKPYERLYYRSSDGSMYFDFVFWHLSQASGWRIYIINDINYGTRPDGSSSAHWLKDPRDTYRYICWDGMIATFNQAKAVAALWADTTAIYIRSENDSFNSIADKLRKG